MSQDVLVTELTLRLALNACWMMANLIDCTEHVDALMRVVVALQLLRDVTSEVTNTY